MERGNNRIANSVKNGEADEVGSELAQATGHKDRFVVHHSSSVECGDITFIRNVAQVNGRGTVNG